jgi:Tfp pilus assembly protein PilE
LVEVLISVVIAGLLMAAVVGAYLAAAASGERAVMNSAAQMKAFALMETVRGARWDILAGVDDWPVSTREFVEALDLPETPSGLDWCTNQVTVTAVGSTPPLRRIQVDCVWALPRRGVFTNQLVTYRAPNQ